MCSKDSQPAWGGAGCPTVKNGAKEQQGGGDRCHRGASGSRHVLWGSGLGVQLCGTRTLHGELGSARHKY